MTSTKTHRTFWIILGIIAIILVGVLAYGLTLKKLSNQAQAPVTQTPGLGELGAECGGEKRLPCKPGLNCVKNRQEDSTGVCTKMSDKPPGKVEPLDAVSPAKSK